MEKKEIWSSGKGIKKKLKISIWCVNVLIPQSIGCILISVSVRPGSRKLLGNLFIAEVLDIL